MPGGMGGMGGGPMDFGKSKSKFQEVPETGVTFVDVIAGVEGAKLGIARSCRLLKNPDKYTQLGAKIPKGCLLVGPPGTGKTLLAKAVAGEAGVPFFLPAKRPSSQELFAGVATPLARDLFEKAKSKAPCIVFIDEIDAVGRQRGSGMGGERRERTKRSTSCSLKWMVSNETPHIALGRNQQTRRFGFGLVASGTIRSSSHGRPTGRCRQSPNLEGALQRQDRLRGC